jgi:glycosyltransferase involved in cell wall biosynthesis
MKILTLPLYPPTHPSSRNRIYNYVEALQKRQEFDFTVVPAVSQEEYNRYYNSPRFLDRYHYHRLERKSRRQAGKLAAEHDVLWLQKSFSLIYWRGMLHPFLKSGKPLIFDIDDAVFLCPPARAPWYLRWAEQKNQIDSIIQNATVVLAGNQRLAEYVGDLGGRPVQLPTPVNTDKFQPGNLGNKEKLTLGWIGSPATHSCLNTLSEIWPQLAGRHHRLEILIVSSTTEGINMDKFHPIPVRFEKWTPENEAPLVRQMDIGLMPLEETEFQRYKCAFKALQYMATGIPVVSSPVGTAADVVGHEEQGLWARSPNEWIEALSRLIESEKLRKSLGQAGRKKAEEKYSFKICLEKITTVFQEFLS